MRRKGDADGCRRGGESAPPASNCSICLAPTPSRRTRAGDLRGAAGETQGVMPNADGHGVAVSQRSATKGKL
jgi:hypothetical protein